MFFAKVERHFILIVSCSFFYEYLREYYGKNDPLKNLSRTRHVKRSEMRLKNTFLSNYLVVSSSKEKAKWRGSTFSDIKVWTCLKMSLICKKFQDSREKSADKLLANVEVL